MKNLTNTRKNRHTKDEISERPEKMYLNHPPFVSSITDTTNSDGLIGDPKINSVASTPARKQG